MRSFVDSMLVDLAEAVSQDFLNSDFEYLFCICGSEDSGSEDTCLFNAKSSEVSCSRVPAAAPKSDSGSEDSGSEDTCLLKASSSEVSCS